MKSRGRQGIWETVRAFTVAPTHRGFDLYEIAKRGRISHHRVLDGKLENFSLPFRYVWPSELDLMARLAGKRLRERWRDRRSREPFTSNSRQRISVWEKCA